MIHMTKTEMLTCMIVLGLMAGLSGCSAGQKTSEEEIMASKYKLASVQQVNGRQGICT